MIIFIIWTEDDLYKIKNKDPEILTKIYKEYSIKIYNLFLIKTNGNKEITDEILSLTFHSALQGINKLNDMNKIFSWLLKIANRRFYDLLRKKYREKKYFDPIANDDIADNSSEIIEKNKILEEKILLTKIAIENIPSNYKEVIKLKYNDHKSQKEISKILNKSESSVQNLLFKARNALKKELLKLVKD